MSEVKTQGDVFAIADGFRDAAMLHLAANANIFGSTENGCTATMLADKNGWRPRKTQILLDGLAAIGLLKKSGNVYNNSAGASQFLVKGAPEYKGDVVEHLRLQWPLWNQFSEVLGSGRPLDLQQEKRLRTDTTASDVFNNAMKQLAGGIIPDVAGSEIFSGKKHVIDLAGGHGDYLSSLAKANPELTGEVWDYASTGPFTESVFRANGVSRRLQFHGRDITQSESYSGARADVVMINDCLHYFAPEEVVNVVQFAKNILNPGGCVAIITPHLDEDAVSPRTAAVFSVYMMVNTANGGVHTTASCERAMRAAGLTPTTKIVGDLEDSAFLVGTLNA